MSRRFRPYKKKANKRKPYKPPSFSDWEQAHEHIKTIENTQFSRDQYYKESARKGNSLSVNFYKQALALSKDQKKHPTLWELKLKRKLEELGVPFEFQHPHVMGNVSFCVMDFYFPSVKLDVELDGVRFHTGKHKEHDQNRTRLLKNDKIQVMRFWNSDITRNFDYVVNQILLRVYRIKPEQIMSIVNGYS